MLEIYLQNYKHYSAIYGPDTAVFLQIGSFYELCDVPEYKTSMQRVAEILGIQVATKKTTEETLMAGFPDQSLHKYAAILTRKNWTVVVIDQKKNAAGKVLARESARVLSPGTHIETAETEAVYVGGLLLEEGSWGSRDPPTFATAVIDLTTGDVVQYHGSSTGKEDSWSADDMMHFFQVHSPRELIVWCKGPLVSEDRIRRATGCQKALIHVRQSQGETGLKSPIVREDLFRRAFQPKTMLPLKEYFGFQEVRQELCLAQLLLFVEDHCPSSMKSLHVPTRWSPETAVFLGNNALVQLNFLGSSAGAGAGAGSREEDSVLGLFLKTSTSFGQRAIRKRLLFPSSDPEILEKRLSQVDWCVEERGARSELLSTLRQIRDLPRLHRALTMGSLSPQEILAIDQSYSQAQKIAGMLFKTPLAAKPELVEEVLGMAKQFQDTFDMEKARTASEDQFCLKGIPEIQRLEKAIQETRREMENLLEKFVQVSGVTPESLKMEFRDATVSVQGSKTVCGILGNRLKGGKRFPAPFETVELHVKKSGGSLEIPGLNLLYATLLRMREELQETIAKALRPVCDALTAEYLRTWDDLENWLAEVDITCTIARVSEERGFCRPVLASGALEGQGASISLKGLRHPLIESQATRVEYVKHDVELGTGSNAGTGWLIYGMNASGKSSLMKSVGIATVLAQCGCYVPASACILRPFRSLFTRILNTDNLWAGLSSFAVEMTEMREILQKANDYSLVLGDELCSGTESMSATALVGAALEWLERRKARYMFATHFHGLVSLPSVMALPSLRIWHLRVRYDVAADRLIYERTLQPGPGSSLYGLEVAKAMAVPLEVLETAHRLRRELLGTATEETAPMSSWNTVIQRRVCERCGSDKVRELEVHHREERVTADALGRLPDGTSMNAIRNLVVLCEACHTEHHAGHETIGPVQQTSEGPVRPISSYAFVPPAAASPAKPKKGLTDEQTNTVLSYLQKYPNCPPARLVFDLEEKEGIKVTVQRLRTLRNGMGTA